MSRCFEVRFLIDIEKTHLPNAAVLPDAAVALRLIEVIPIVMEQARGPMVADSVTVTPVQEVVDEALEQERLRAELAETKGILDSFRGALEHSNNAAKRRGEERDRYRTALLHQAGDNLCRLSEQDIEELTSCKVQPPPKAEMLASCERFIDQIIGERGELSGCKTIAQLETDLAELEASFDFRWKADMRAIKRWQEAHPGKELVWPDHADLCVWLMEQLDNKGVHDAAVKDHSTKMVEE